MLSDIADLPSIKLTDTDWLRFELDPLTPFGREIALKELRETPEVKEQAIEELKNLLQGNLVINCQLLLRGPGLKLSPSKRNLIIILWMFINSINRRQRFVRST